MVQISFRPLTGIVLDEETEDEIHCGFRPLTGMVPG